MKKIKNLLSKGNTNAKLAKNTYFGYPESYILYLSPYRQNSKGINVCPHASPQCAAACLNTAGRGAFSNVQRSRQEKTDYFLADRAAFIQQLWKELSRINTKAIKKGIKIPVRLNGTSDLDWPKIFIAYGLPLSSFDSLIFYDYTKVYSRLEKYSGALLFDTNDSLKLNYHLTFSRSEVNEHEAIEALKNGFNVAVVFKGQLPESWKGYKVINGDESDLRFEDPKNVVIGLKAKGKARKDSSGFVVNS